MKTTTAAARQRPSIRATWAAKPQVVRSSRAVLTACSAPSPSCSASSSTLLPRLFTASDSRASAISFAGLMSPSFSPAVFSSAVICSSRAWSFCSRLPASCARPPSRRSWSARSRAPWRSRLAGPVERRVAGDLGVGFREPVEDLRDQARPQVRVRVVPRVERDLLDAAAERRVVARRPLRLERADPRAHQRHERALAGPPVTEEPDRDRRVDLVRDQDRAERLDVGVEADVVDRAAHRSGSPPARALRPRRARRRAARRRLQRIRSRSAWGRPRACAERTRASARGATSARRRRRRPDRRSRGRGGGRGGRGSVCAAIAGLVGGERTLEQADRAAAAARPVGARRSAPPGPSKRLPPVFGAVLRSDAHSAAICSGVAPAEISAAATIAAEGRPPIRGISGAGSWSRPGACARRSPSISLRPRGPTSICRKGIVSGIGSRATTILARGPR